MQCGFRKADFFWWHEFVCILCVSKEAKRQPRRPTQQDLFGGLQDRKLSPDQADLATEKLGEVGRRNEEGLRHGFGTRFREELLAVDAQRRGGRVTVERSVLRGVTGGPPARVIAERSVLRGVTGGPPDQRFPQGALEAKGRGNTADPLGTASSPPAWGDPSAEPDERKGRKPECLRTFPRGEAEQLEPSCARLRPAIGAVTKSPGGPAAVRKRGRPRRFGREVHPSKSNQGRAWRIRIGNTVNKRQREGPSRCGFLFLREFQGGVW